MDYRSSIPAESRDCQVSGELFTWGVIVTLYIAAFAVLQLEKHWHSTAPVLFTLATLFALGRLVVWVWNNPDGFRGGIAFTLAIFAIWAAIWFVKKVEANLHSENRRDQREFKVSFELGGLDSERYSDGVQYMLARFKYKTGTGHSPKVGVKADLQIFDDNSLRKKEFPGVWHRSIIRSKGFKSGDYADLVLGLVKATGIDAYEYNVIKTVNGTELSPILTPLDGSRFYILAAFIGRTDDEVLIETNQWFLVDAGVNPRFVGCMQPPHLL